MPDRTAGQGGNLYPLAEHFLGILDSQDQASTLRKEVSRYTEWVAKKEQELAKAYGKARADPRQRPASGWVEEDLDFLLLEYRRNILAIILEAVEFEKYILRELESEGSTGKTILELLQEVFAQVDELPCPQKNIIPGEFSVKVPPPMQRMVIEKARLEQSRNNFLSGNLDELYDMQITVLGVVFDKWTLELVPKAMLKVIAIKLKAFGISKNWMLVVFDPV